MKERFTAEVAAVDVESASGRYTFRGVASTIGNVDRSGRVFLLGAFGSKAIKVPLFYQHDDRQVIGSSVLTPNGNVLRHESSLNPKVPQSAMVQALIDDGDIMSTSISWLGDHYYGWSQLVREAPELAKQAASMGIPQLEDIMYCSRAQIVENSVVPIPANERALIEMRAMVESKLQVASLARGAAAYTPEPYSVEPDEIVKCPKCQKMNEPDARFCDQCGTNLVEALNASIAERHKAAGARHSTNDQTLIQTAHDALLDLGAVCPQPAGADALTEEPRPPDLSGLEGGWADSIRTPENSGVALQLLNGVDTQNVPPDPFDVLDRELAKIEAELPGVTNSSDKETRT